MGVQADASNFNAGQTTSPGPDCAAVTPNLTLTSGHFFPLVEPVSDMTWPRPSRGHVYLCRGWPRGDHGGIVESVAGNTYYDLFGLQPTATPAEIKATYRRLIPRVHPDSGGTDALFHQVQEAYETLSDPAKRATYDRRMKHAPQGAGAGLRAAWDGADERHPPRARSSNAWRPHPGARLPRRQRRAERVRNLGARGWLRTQPR